jgi:NAD(P)H-flavin reductase
MWLTYHMMKWEDVEQQESDQKCTICGRPMMQTEVITDEKGLGYQGFVCHSDKQVTWLRVA